MAFNRYQSVGLQPPTIPGGIYLPPMISLIEPLERENLVINPSFEDTTTPPTNWTSSGASVSRVTTDAFKGVACCRVFNQTAGGAIGIYGAATPLSLTSGNTYAFSFYAKTFTSLYLKPSLTFGIGTTGNAFLTSRTVNLTPIWTRYWLAYTETSSTSRRLLFQLNNPLISFGSFLLDAVQVELCDPGYTFPTTYIDGDQQGIVSGENPAPYFWTGTPRLSTSVRIGTTRSGGRIWRLDKLGFDLLGVEGLGSAPVDLQPVEYTLLDGETPARNRKGPRQFSLIGRHDADTFRSLKARIGGLAGLLDRDFIDDDGVIKLLIQPMNERQDPMGEECELVCTYLGGLGNAINNFNSELSTIELEMHRPNIMSVREYTSGQVNIPDSEVTNFIAYRTRDGAWSNLSLGVTGGAVLAIMPHPNGTIFVGGSFTTAGATSADFCAIYNPATDTWSNINSSDTTFGAAVRAFALGPDGEVYIGGDFTNAAGNANADRICVVSATGGSLAALGTGISTGDVRAIKVLGQKVFVGGTFTGAGGVGSTNSIAYWDLVTSVWNPLGTGATTGNGVYAIDGRGNTLYAGGTYTGMGGVANTTRIASFNLVSTTWSAMSTGSDGSVFAILMHQKNNSVYVGGSMTTLGGASINNIGLWTGFTFEPVGASTTFAGGSQVIATLAYDFEGDLWAGGTFTSLLSGNLIPTPNVARLAGSVWVMGNFEDTAVINALSFTKTGTMYIGWNTDVNPTTGTQMTITNTGSARTYPRLFFQANGEPVRIYGMENVTTRKKIYFNYTMYNDEIIYIDFDPIKQSMVSEANGDISYTVLAGSDLASFYLIPGENVLEFMINTGGEMHIWWKNAHALLDTTWYSPGRGV